MKFLRSISIGGLPDIQQLWSSKLLLLIHASQSNMQESHGHNFLLLFFFFLKVRSLKVNTSWRKSCVKITKLIEILCLHFCIQTTSRSYHAQHLLVHTWQLKTPQCHCQLVFWCSYKHAEGQIMKFFVVADKLTSMQLPTGNTRYHQCIAVTIRAWYSDSLMTVTSPYSVKETIYLLSSGLWID